jgi:VWFA-related protein
MLPFPRQTIFGRCPSNAPLAKTVRRGEQSQVNCYSIHGIVRRALQCGMLVAIVLVAAFVYAQDAPPQKISTREMQGPVIKVPVDLVNVFFVAKDKHGGLVSDLNRAEITVEEEGKPQEISFFEKDTSVPLTIAMMIDTSGSIGEANIMPLEQEGAVEFLHTVMRQGDQTLVIHFDLDVELDQDLTDRLPALERAIKNTRVNTGGGHQGPINTNIGGTHLYDAAVLACDDKLREEAGRKVMILITDGEDQGSKYKLNDSITAAQKANTVIYPIYFQPSLSSHFSIGYGRQPQSYGNTGVLNKLAEETGGKAYYPRSIADLRKTFDEIKSELHQQYRLAYVPSNTTRDGTYRKIQVRSSRGDLKVVARKGYYAPRD